MLNRRGLRGKDGVTVGTAVGGGEKTSYTSVVVHHTFVRSQLSICGKDSLAKLAVICAFGGGGGSCDVGVVE